MPASFSGTRGARIVAVAAVVALTAVVGVLAVLALQSTRAGEAPGETMRPAPTFSFGTDATASATPTPSTAALSPAADERFLAINGDTYWRATAGECGGTAPLVEFSTDAGESWTAATPPDARQVLGVAILGEGDGEVIAAVGDACEPALLRTYTGGVEWGSYPDALAAATYVDPADRASIVIAGSATPAPCADPRSVRASRGVVGVVCDGTASVLTAGTWTALAESAAALDAVSGTVVAAHVTDACPGGLAVTQFTGTTGAQLGCISGVDPAEPAALSLLGDDLALWSGDRLLALD